MYAITMQTAQLQRMRYYDDDLQNYDFPRLENVPEWAYIKQENLSYDTEIEKSVEDEEVTNEQAFFNEIANYLV